MRAICVIATVLTLVQVGSTQTPNRQGAGIQRWTQVHFDPKGHDVPYSFIIDGKKSRDVVPGWMPRSEEQKLDSHRIRQTQIRTDPKSGLEVRCVSIAYNDFPAVEWTVYLKNTGSHDSPIIENLQALDSEFEREGATEFLLHHNVGSPASRSDYAPLETELGPGATKHISAAGGRPTNSDMSYFNMSEGDRGTIVVVGWPGQWAADFTRDAARGLRIRAGQELTHFKLHPGEEVRTPLIVLLHWQGDWLGGQNEWRQWMMAYGMPKPGGRLPKPMMLASSSRAYREMIGGNEANQIMHIDRYLEEKFKLDYWWMDAGWYVQQHGWPQVGTWEVDKTRFPNGFKPISDHAHAKGVKILVWFEPERVAPDTWISNHHPDWLLSPIASLESRSSSKIGRNEPNVVFNTAKHVVSWNGITWQPRSVSFHPGMNGEYSVVRWTSPTFGQYRIDCGFTGIDEKTTTDVHVLSGKHNLFKGLINLRGQGKHASYHGSVWLEAGDTVDFVVGYGNDSYAYDSTGLAAVVTGRNGDRHDAALEYGGGQWSYGYLAPGAKPLPYTFKPYDVHSRGGANDDQLLNLGNPDAWKWLVEHVDKLIVDNGIDLYRQDFNIDPLEFWRGNDSPDRQGITENKHVVGYLAYWDELRRRHPNMLIDSCASGGRRNDLETMRRAVPLWRSDYAYESIGHQGMAYGISMWLPFHGTGTVATTDAPYYGGGVTPIQPYAFWSNAAPGFGCGIDIREKGLDYDLLRKLFGEWRDISSFYYGDYYPLTTYSQEDNVWIAWQFNEPAAGSGLIQAFRRNKASEESVPVKLRGLDRKGTYSIAIVDAPGCASLAARSWSGSELMDEGLILRLKDAPSAAVITYRLNRR